METRMVSGAVQNRAPRLVVKETGQTCYFGIPYPEMLRQGVWRFVSVGGAAKLTRDGRLYLQERFPDIRFRAGSMDARFEIPETQLDQVFAVILDNGVQMAEMDTAREIWEELCGNELPEPILDVADVRRMHSTYVTPMYQPRVGLARSVNRPGMLIRRLLRLHELSVPQDVFLRLVRSPYVRFFSPDMLLGVDDPEAKAVPDPKDPTRTIEIGTNLFAF